MWWWRQSHDDDLDAAFFDLVRMVMRMDGKLNLILDALEIDGEETDYS